MDYYEVRRDLEILRRLERRGKERRVELVSFVLIVLGRNVYYERIVEYCEV